MKIRRNALLAKPEHRFHQISSSHPTFRQVMGRGPREEDYEGVHTTSNELIAAAYAMSAWEQSNEGYPVILELDVAGLSPIPDVDAIFIGLPAIMDSAIRSDAARLFQNAKGDVRKIYRFAENYRDNAEGDIGLPQAGQHPSAFVFHHIPNDPILSLLDILSELNAADDKVREIFHAWAVDGEQPPQLVLTRMVEQQRYLADFDTDRLVRVVAFQPWWPKIFDAWWETGDDELEAKAEAIERVGWRIVTTEDDVNMNLGKTKAIYEAPATATHSVEYHGTTSAVVGKAFPDLQLPSNAPFPVGEPDSSDDGEIE